jgi:tetratricopeptide (TPR) repeat protein
MAASCPAQSLDERLDEQRFLRGLADLQLAEILEQYNESHPAADDLQRLDREITALKLGLNNLPNTIADRLPSIDAILAARAQIIESHEADPRRAIWLIEQASDMYFLLLPTEGAGLTALFGVPSDAQRNIARRAAMGINAAAADAELAIEALLQNIASQPGFSTNFTLQSQRRRLSQDERERRIPFFRGIGAVLQAMLGEHDAGNRSAMLEQAVLSLSRVTALLEHDLAAQARVYWGLALAELNQHDKAMEQFRAAATDPAAHASTIFAARMGAVHSFVLLDGPEAGLRGLDDIAPRYQGDADFFYRLLIADQRYLLYQQWAKGEMRDRQDQLRQQSLQGYVALLPRDTSPGAVAMTRIVSERLSRASRGHVTDPELPAMVSILRADQLAQDDSTRQEALALLATVLARPSLTDEDRAAAMYALAVAKERAGLLDEAAELFYETALKFPNLSPSERAAEQAAVLASRSHSRGEPGSSDRLRRALDLVLARYSNLVSIDSWRVLRGQLALEELDFDVADQALGVVPASSPLSPQAQFLLVAVQHARMSTGESTSERLASARSLIKSANDTRAEFVAQVAQATDDGRQQLLRDLIARLGIFIAEAQIELGQPNEALSTLDEVERGKVSEPGHIADLLRARIAARRAAGSSDSIQDEVNRLMQVSPAAAGDVIASSLHSYRAEVEDHLRMDRGEDARELARNELLPLSQALDRWLDDHDPGDEQADSMVQLIADCARLAESWGEALKAYDRLARRRPDSLDVLFGRAECLFHIGGPANLSEAMTLYKRINAARVDDADVFYWTSELRMLQILDQSGSNVQQIAPRIDRLRVRDPQLGGDALRREFERLRREHDQRD